MRVIAGTARGKQLATLKGNNTRPTSDRVREALFNILFSQIGPLNNKSVLDLFAGSGALAIEALSRGAQKAWLVENSAEAVKIIRKNLISCRFSDHADVIAMDAWRALTSFSTVAPFDLIFIDPPYRQDLALQALQQIAENAFLAKGGLACVETDAKESLPDEINGLACTDRRRYGSTLLHFYAHARQDMS